uniref:Peptidase S1 domain-containing protein n=1 Tax=Timema douglasi TaxID=61478 RepID=A0A7R8Z6R1_TIMDO|nr:unnamed protein product [Timema douglasi]
MFPRMLIFSYVMIFFMSDVITLGKTDSVSEVTYRQCFSGSWKCVGISQCPATSDKFQQVEDKQRARELFSMYACGIKDGVLQVCCHSSFIKSDSLDSPNTQADKSFRQCASKSWRCVDISNCPRTAENVYQANFETSKKLSAQYFCGMRGDIIKVCCHSNFIKEEDKMSLLPINECGEISLDVRITNGKDAKPFQFPWMALLGYKDPQDNIHYMCGGSLINDRYVLTAAHCERPKTSERVNLKMVRLGEVDLDKQIDCDESKGLKRCAGPAIDIPIEKIISHKQYGTLLKNDIALLRLKNRVQTFTDHIKPICLPFGVTITGNEIKVYEVAGWGKTDTWDDEGSRILQHVQIRSQTLDYCNEQYSKSKDVWPIDATQLCVGADMGKDSCYGDSGGPLMDWKLSNELNKTVVVQVGIVSFGTVRCADKYTPAVYTRVTAYLDWILANIEP